MLDRGSCYYGFDCVTSTWWPSNRLKPWVLGISAGRWRKMWEDASWRSSSHHPQSIYRCFHVMSSVSLVTVLNWCLGIDNIAILILRVLKKLLSTAFPQTPYYRQHLTSILNCPTNLADAVISRLHYSESVDSKMSAWLLVSICKISKILGDMSREEEWSQNYWRIWIEEEHL